MTAEKADLAVATAVVVQLQLVALVAATAVAAAKEAVAVPALAEAALYVSFGVLAAHSPLRIRATCNN
jgi:hypothetical protein